MISTGHPYKTAKKTEVVDLENSNDACNYLDNFPVEISFAVGGNLASTPIICGGELNDWDYSSSNKCFKYTKGGWQHYVTMREERRKAAGIVYDDAFHIFGGQDTIGYALQSSELVRLDGTSTEGPKLPSRIFHHAIAFINSTVSIITGGYTSTYRSQTWYFNHATQKFQYGPNLIKRRMWHSSGTITDHVTKEKIFIVAGGYFGVSGYTGSHLDSTEILLNGEWVAGKTDGQL